uniref:Branched-chain-amino-acid aminotransferase n=1 Tax=Meloidogyne floridensis TaxID=298350 RepID=A0A915P744_9BILA
MRLLIISLLFLFITNIVCPPKKHSRDSPKEDFDPNKRRSVSGSDTGTGTGTSNPDATTSDGVPSPQGEPQTDFSGLEESFGNNPFLNQQQQPPHVVGSSFQTFDYPSDISDYYNQPIFSPPREYWKQADQTGQVDYPTTYQPTFTPLPFSHQSDSFIQLTPLFVADDKSQQEDQTSKQAGPKSQLDPKDEIPKPKGRIKDRANRRVVALGYTPQEINFDKTHRKGHFMGHCYICRRYGFSSNDFDGDELLKIITELVRLDKEWVPYSSTASLYIRPTMIGTDPTLGVANPKNAKLFVLSGPVGSFYSTGFNPVSLFADPSFVRAFPGGVGSFKMGCNYAPTIMLGKIASEFGCQQVLWLSGEDQKLTEVGSMNIFLYWINEEGEKELITPPLDDGLILPGIVRESVLTLVREWDEFKVSESYPTIPQMKKAIAEKRLLQIFGTGTAVALVPVGRIVFRNQETNSIEEFKIPTMNSGATVMQRLYETIIDIQQGRRDRPEWIYVID